MEQIVGLLFNYGAMGVVLAWFMLRLEKHLRRQTRATNLVARTLLRLLEHQDPVGASKLSKELYRIDGNGTPDDSDE